METRNSGLLIHIRDKIDSPSGFYPMFDGKVKLRRMKMNQINNSKKIYHAAIYVRLSKEDGDVATAGKRESNSISNQKDLIKNFLKDKKDIVLYQNGWMTVTAVLILNVLHFQMMLEDIKKGIVDCVVVKDLSRFGREYMMPENISKDYFRHLACGLLRVNDHYDSLEGKKSGRRNRNSLQESH